MRRVNSVYFFSVLPGVSPQSTAKKNNLDFTRRTRRRIIFHVGLSVDGSMETGNATRAFSTAVVRGGSLGRPECAQRRPLYFRRLEKVTAGSRHAGCLKIGRIDRQEGTILGLSAGIRQISDAPGLVGVVNIFLFLVE